MSATLKMAVDGTVAKVTIQRPERLNALNSQLLGELDDITSEIIERSDIRVVLITGSGDRAFASGADVTEFDALAGATGYAFCRRGQDVLTRWETLPVPTIAVINGWALGGGCELALACTLRMASDKARLGLPEITLGVMPGYGGTQRLTRLVGPGHAMELMLTGVPINSVRAFEMGLVNRVVAHEELDIEAASLAEVLSNRAPLAVRYVMECVNAATDLPLGAGLRLEAGLAGILTGTQDKREGVEAFLAKRRPRWRGE